MLFEERKRQLKNGTKALFRSPIKEDAEEMARFLKQCCGETEFLLRSANECNETKENEEAFLQSINNSDTCVMIVCLVQGEIAGNCQINFNKREKTKHRAQIGITILKKFWGLGIGTIMIEELLQIARTYGVLQVELDFIEGNDRAKGLYEKMGFRVIAEHPNAICFQDGSLHKEYSMICEL